MISNAYNLNKTQTLDGKCLKVLLPTLPCYSSVASIVSNLYAFPLMWDTTTGKSLWYQGMKPQDTENLIFDK